MANPLNDISLILTKAYKKGFLQDVKTEEVTWLTQEANALFSDDGVFSATYARNIPNTMVVAGDSITNSDGFHGNRTFWAYAQNYLNQRLNIISNAGVGGNTSTQLLARWDTDVTALAPAWVHIMIGRNDLVGTDAAVMTTLITGNIQSMLTKAFNAGIRVVVGTILPSTGFNAVQNDALGRVNRWIRNLAWTQNVIVVDYNSVITDPATGAPVTAMLTDGTHPGVKGGALMGKLLAAALDTRLLPTTVLLNSEVDPGNLLLTGRFTAGGAGTVPTNWFETGAVGGARTYSKVTRTDGVAGSYQRIVVPAGGSVDLMQNVNIGSTLAIGQKVNFRIEYKASALEVLASGQYLFAQIGAYNGTSFTNYVYDLPYGAGTENVIGFDRSGVFLTADLTIPAGTTLVQAGVRIGGGITLDLDRASLQIAP